MWELESFATGIVASKLPDLGKSSKKSIPSQHSGLISN
jgi:hypothetical protein